MRIRLRWLIQQTVNEEIDPLQKNIAALTLGGLTLLSAPAMASEGWIADFDKAVEIAKAEKKDLFVDFTGSDWCGWCIKLDSEVFEHEAFLEGVKENYVLVALDFPRKEENIAKVPNMERNKELQQKYGVGGFPTILLMNSDGVVYGKTGYKPGGPETYVEHLNELRESGRGPLMKVTNAFDKYEQAPEGEAKTAALDGILSVMIDLDFGSPLASKLIEPARKALELDPENKSGMQLRAVHALSNVGEQSPELLAMAKKLDPKNAHGALESQVHAMFQKVKDAPTAMAALAQLDELNKLQFKDSSTGFLLNFTATSWAAGPMQDPEKTKHYAAIAKKIGSDNEERMNFINEKLSQEVTPPVDKQEEEEGAGQ